MFITTDNEGRQLILAISDLALKHGGVQALNMVNQAVTIMNKSENKNDFENSDKNVKEIKK
jgi:hypothetical protein